MKRGLQEKSSKKRTRLSVLGLSPPGFLSAGSGDRKWFYLLLLLILAAYLLTFSSVPISTLDDQLMLTSAMFFVETGKFTAPSRFADKKFGISQFGQTAVTGEVYSRYTSGYPLILSIFIIIARLCSSLFGSLAADLILCLPSILSLAALAILIWRAALRLGLRPATASCTVLGLALGTFVWPYVGVNFSEPYQMLFIFATFYCLLASWQHEEKWWQYETLGGLALAYAIWIKPALGVMAPVFVLGTLLEWRKRVGIGQALLKSFLFAIPGLLTSFYILASNFLLFGNANDFGYAGELFSAPLSKGIVDLTVGWARGIVWFAPLATLAPWGLVKLIKRGKSSPAAVMGTAVIVYFILLCKWHGYDGGHCWGPRLLLPILPLLILPAGVAMDSRRMRWVGCMLVITGIAVNSLGALINYQSYYITIRSAKRDYLKLDPAFNQIRCHFWLLRVQTQALSSGVLESDLPLWQNPPWIGKYPDAIPPPYSRIDQPICNSWPLRLALPESRWRREENWYLRALMEVAISKYEQGDMTGAMELIDEGLRLDPDYKQLIAAKGLVYYSLKDMKRALQQFSLSLKHDPDFELGLYGVAIVMEALGNPREAYLIYTRLLKLPLETLDRKEILARIGELTPR